jgi:hypothetical protein
MRKLQIVGALLFATLMLGSTIVTSASAGWLADGEPITEALPTETEGLLELIALSAGTVSFVIDCEYIFDGSVGPENAGKITEVLNTSHETVGNDGSTLSGTGLHCPVTKDEGDTTACKSGSTATVWPANLPWSTELEGMESEPHILDVFSGTGGEPGYEVECTILLGIKATDLCVATMSAKVESTEENDVLATFNSESPIESGKANCNTRGAGAGDIAGEGLFLLTNGKSLWLLICLPASNGQYPSFTYCMLEWEKGVYQNGWNDYLL